ncbi:hypothetical protein [Streptomyces sp. NPDC020298]|uniref:hypothetical protein n=1 Tax=unclassified Streptomyces TaxID=2593676 RepID=UPI0033CD9B4B
MGVFARLLRRSKATEEASATEPLTGAESGGSEAEEPPEEATPAASAESGASESGVPASEAASSDGGETGQAAATEATEIPKQQSAEEAADNEAGDGART